MEIDAIRAADNDDVTYLFVTAQRTFTLFLGQRQNALGISHFCEFDFDRVCFYAAVVTFLPGKASD